MLYNLLFNNQIKRSIALDANEGLDDLAFENGWRISVHALESKRLSKDIYVMPIEEWRRYLSNLAGDDWLMVDDARFSVYYEDNADDSDEDEFDEELMCCSESSDEEEYIE
jgi:hypothetical protein